jgi:hypothetical protein
MLVMVASVEGIGMTSVVSSQSIECQALSIIAMLAVPQVHVTMSLTAAAAELFATMSDVAHTLG